MISGTPDYVPEPRFALLGAVGLLMLLMVPPARPGFQVPCFRLVADTESRARAA